MPRTKSDQEIKTGEAPGPRLDGGSVLILAMLLVTLLTALALWFAQRINSNEMRMEADIAGIQALELAETVLHWNTDRVWRQFINYSDAYRTGTGTVNPVIWLAVTTDDKNGNGVRDESEPPPGGNSFGSDWTVFGQGEAKYESKVIAYSLTSRYVDLDLTVTTRVRDAMKGRYAYRKLRKLIRYGYLVPSKAFDFVYFANNYGWMYGNTIYTYGNVGSNADLGFRSAPTCDGFLYAARNPALGALGVVKQGGGFEYPRFDSLPQYRAIGATTPSLRPSDPAWTEDQNGNGVLDTGEDSNANGILDATPFGLGYSGMQDRLEAQNPLNMPFLGNLVVYKDQAVPFLRPNRPDLGEYGAGVGGIVKQLKAPGLDPSNPANYNVIVDKVYGSKAGENGLYSTVVGTGTNQAVTLNAIPTPLEINPDKQERNGNVALVGTAKQPIVILGPVVITNDLVIKGVVKGQGTFYVGRNTHVVGSILYSDSPHWKQNDLNFSATEALNKGKDFAGFASKGSIILGQYFRSDDSWDWTKNTYFRTGFQNATIQAYQVDPTDAAIGYVTGSTPEGFPTFHGDYTLYDGGKRYNDTPDWTTAAPAQARRYYESSFSNEYIRTIAEKPQELHGVFYTNHLYGGRVDNPKFYGAMVARDEGIVFDGSLRMYYDPRASSGEPDSHVNIFLPREASYTILLWEELPATEYAE
ncbi:MAG: hypothetical protein HY291_19880 [Planctomycetes bacterium]|nr:hypothetical protein [Planctomycetota bacterium]